LQVESLDLDANGVARRADGKVVFVEGALPGERVRVQVTRRKPQWEQAVLTELLAPSAQRVAPACPHYGLHAGACGGCRMQHLHPAAQVAVKQRVLEDQLWHLGRLRPEQVLRPIEGPAWGYRQRARLSVRHVAKKGGVLVGFHERKSSYVADMTRCPVLPPAVEALLRPLRALVEAMPARDRVPQIELAVGDHAGGVIALVLRHLQPLVAADLRLLRDFAHAHRVQWWLQPGGPATVHRLDDAEAGRGGPGGEGGEGAELAYTLPEFGLVMPYRPTDFTQVNAAVNRVLVGRAVRLLDAQPDERVIDWFCGLGNFTLALATRARAVLGVEGSAALLQRARAGAQRNGLAGRTAFEACNLFDLDAERLARFGAAQRWLVDPPREGALALVKALVELQERPPAGWQPPRRIVYVSCNPATLARDAGLLVHQGGWRCTAAGAVNMFPHTAHVESMAVFERP
jgi:23S rRNA (uracil1939-C5)-methyltransferase